MIIYEMFKREVPWQDKKVHWIIQTVCNNNERPELPPNCKGKFKELIEGCWDKDPRQRPTFKSIVSLLESLRETYAEEIEKFTLTLEVGKNLKVNQVKDVLLRKNSLFSPRTKSSSANLELNK